MKTPLITAVIPTYKRPELLKRAVRSVLGQSFSHLLVLICDNASGEETDLVVEELMQQDARVKLLKHSSTIPMVQNFQAGLMHVTTPYVCFLPDDDFFGPSYFESVIEVLIRDPQLAFAGGGGMNMEKDYTLKSISATGPKVPHSGYYPQPTGYFAFLRSECRVGFPAMLFKTEIVKELGGFDLRLRNGIDEDLIAKCSIRHPVHFITDQPSFYFGYQHESSISRQIDFPLFEKECLIMHENTSSSPLSPIEKDEVDLFFNKRHKKILSSAYKYFCARKEFREAIKYAEKMYILTHARAWKRKKIEATLYIRFPFLPSFYSKLKMYEKTVRTFLKGRKCAPTSHAESHVVPDAELWKEYTLKLEGKEPLAKKQSSY